MASSWTWYVTTRWLSSRSSGFQFIQKYNQGNEYSVGLGRRQQVRAKNVHVNRQILPPSFAFSPPPLPCYDMAACRCYPHFCRRPAILISISSQTVVRSSWSDSRLRVRASFAGDHANPRCTPCKACWLDTTHRLLQRSVLFSVKVKFASCLLQLTIIVKSAQQNSKIAQQNSKQTIILQSTCLEKKLLVARA